MSNVRVLVGTRKGAFVLTSDGKRKNWEVSGPHFAGWEMYHLKGSPVDPNRIYASQTSGWFGQLIQRSERRRQDLGAGRATSSPTTAMPGTHLWYDGTPHPWEFKRVWHLEPSLTDPDTVFAGVEDAALFQTTDGGQNWQELPGLRTHGTGPHWQPGAGGMCLHTIFIDPTNPQRIYIAISAAGAFRTDDGGRHLEADQSRPEVAVHSRSRTPKSATASTGLRCIRRGQTCCSCRSTGTSCAATTPAISGRSERQSAD